VSDEKEEKKPAGIKSLLESLGLQTTLENGHEIGCACAACQELRDARFAELKKQSQRGEKAETLIEMLALEARKRKGH
jgi:hypothetical protein